MMLFIQQNMFRIQAHFDYLDITVKRKLSQVLLNFLLIIFQFIKYRNQEQVQITTMHNSFRQLSIVEPLPYPTQEQLLSHPCILDIEAMDEKLTTLNLDIYSMNMLALEIKQSLMHLECKLQYFSRCGIRLMALIDCIFEQFGIDYYYLSKLISYIRYCNGKWKKQLMKAICYINYDPKVEAVFYYKAERNVYLFSTLKTNNTIVCKMLQRLISRGQLSTNNKKYLHSKGLSKTYETILKKIVPILQEKEEQTYFKIQLINEFVKFTMLYVKLCITLKDQQTVFNNFLLLVSYLCRIIRKFYCHKIMKDIELSLKIIKRGFQTFISVFQRRGVGFNIKVEQIKLIIRLIDGKYPFQPSKLTNENAFIVRLLQNILANWRKNHLRLQKARLNKVKSENEELKQMEVIKNQQNKNKIYNRLNTRKVSTLKLQIIKINKSMSNLNRRKSIKKSQSEHNLGKQLALPFQKTTNIKIRREIEHGADHYFQNMSHFKQSKSFSKDKRRVLSSKKQNTQEKLLKLQDYTNYYNSRIKVIPNSNKIQLYQADKMANYYRAKPKLKLQLNS